MAAYEIPLRGGAPSRLRISLAGVSYGLLLTWCVPAQVWTLEIDDVNGNRLLSGVPLVTGADLLAQFQYLGIGGMLIAQTDHNYMVPPTFTNLGQTGHLYFVVP
jgi:hypothetical protein